MLPSDEPLARDRRPNGSHRISGSIFAALVVMVGLIINLPYRYLPRDEQLASSAVNAGNNMPLIEHPIDVMAGWPMRYRHLQETEQGVIARRHSVTAAVVNLLIVSAVALLVYQFTLYRGRAMRTSLRPTQTKRTMDLIVAAGAIAIPLVVLSQAAWNYRQHQRLFRVLNRQGPCQMTIVLPEPIVNRVPRSIASLYQRVRSATLLRGNTSLVRTVLALPTLQSLELTGTFYDQTALQELLPATLLDSIAVHRDDLTSPTMAAIGSIASLQQLDLSDSNVNGSLLDPIRRIPALRHVTLNRTPLRLRDVSGDGSWDETVTRLNLTIVQDDQPDALELIGWKKLEVLSVDLPSSVDRHTLLEIHLESLPRLVKLQLDQYQRIALTCKHLPRLLEIGQDSRPDTMFMRYESQINGLTWFAKLDLQDLPSLQRVESLMTDLETLRLKDLPNLADLILSSHRYRGGGDVIRVPMPAGRGQSIIDFLGDSQAAASVEFPFGSLAGVRFQSLTNNRAIRKLRLGSNEVTFGQLRPIGEMDSIEDLHLGECQLKTGDVEWLLTELPKLSLLQANVFAVESVDLSGIDSLNTLLLSPMLGPREFRLVDMPNVNTQIYLLRTPQRLEIRNADQLRGFGIAGLWPADSELTPLRKLSWFTACGSHVDDQLLQKIADCKDLDELTLAYGNLSRDALIGLAGFDKLSTLFLPGAAVDDSVTRNWTALSRLQYLNLDDTHVGAETIRWASRLRSLKAFSINGVPLDAAGADAVAELGDVRELGLADTGIDPDVLLPVLEKKVVQQLDVTGVTLDEAVLRAIGRCNSLKSIRIDRCRFDHDDLVAMLKTKQPLEVMINQDHPDLDDSLRDAIATCGLPYRIEKSSERMLMLQDAAGSLVEIDAEHHQTLINAQLTQRRPGRVDVRAIRQAATH